MKSFPEGPCGPQVHIAHIRKSCIFKHHVIETRCLEKIINCTNSRKYRLFTFAMVKCDILLTLQRYINQFRIDIKYPYRTEVGNSRARQGRNSSMACASILKIKIQIKTSIFYAYVCTIVLSFHGNISKNNRTITKEKKSRILLP